MRIYYQKNNILVRQAFPTDADMLAGRLRRTDVEEIWASHTLTSWEALHESIVNATMALSITNHGSVVGVFGIRAESILGKKATIWFLASDDLDKIKYRFLRHSKGFVGMFLCFYPYLFNYVDVRNKPSIDWLRFCGATIEEPKPYGDMRLPFHYFHFERD